MHGIVEKNAYVSVAKVLAGKVGRLMTDDGFKDVPKDLPLLKERTDPIKYYKMLYRFCLIFE